MKKLRRILTLMLLTLLLTNCGRAKLNLNEEVTLKGKLSHQEILDGDAYKKISVLTLDKPVYIDGDLVEKIELEYNKDLKTDTEITITGTLKDNRNSTYNYLFSVNDIADVLSYVNTFQHKDFSITIPAELIKEIIVEKIDAGYKFSLPMKNDKKGELFRAISVTEKEYKELEKKYDRNIEVIREDDDKIIVFIHKGEDLPDEYEDQIQVVYEKMTIIQKNVKIK